MSLRSSLKRESRRQDARDEENRIDKESRRLLYEHRIRKEHLSFNEAAVQLFEKAIKQMDEPGYDEDYYG